MSIEPDPSRVTLSSGDILETSEALRIPWRPTVGWRAGGVSLILDVLRDPRLVPADGLVSSESAADAFLGVQAWRLVVTDHGAGAGGAIGSVSILLAARTSIGI